MIPTDQTNCYTTDGELISCSGTGQDADIPKTVPDPDSRFVTESDTVIDRYTGLLWTKDAGMSQFPLSWPEAFEFIRKINENKLLGLKNWRLPARDELFSLISHARINPAVVCPERFDNLFNGYYWTCDACARYPRQAWYIHMGGGRVVKGMMDQSSMVWPVHDGLSGSRLKNYENDINLLPAQRFKVSKECVLDHQTGLCWLKDADPVSGAVTWDMALKFIISMNRRATNGSANWRLPNIRELASITDILKHSPAIAGAELFESIQPFYWSATTSVYEPSYAWTLYTTDGNIGVGYKKNPEFHIWPVRG